MFLRVGLLGVAICGVASAGQQPDAGALKQALDTLLNARSDEPAAPLAEAWKVVAAADYSQLPQIFQAADQANRLSANWLSMALDRIVQQNRAEGRQLPVDLLKSIALDSRYALLARKMSLEMLAQEDEKGVEALQVLLIGPRPSWLGTTCTR